MNVFRSISRSLWNVLDVAKAPEVRGKTLDAVRQKPVPAVLGLSRLRDGFEQSPRTAAAERSSPRPAFNRATLQRDGFDSGSSRRSPLDLKGGTQARFSTRQEVAAPPPPAAFTASLSDLASLLAA